MAIKIRIPIMWRFIDMVYPPRGRLPEDLEPLEAYVEGGKKFFIF